MSLKTKKGLETCLFFGVTHTFSLPVTTKDGVEIFNPKMKALIINHTQSLISAQILVCESIPALAKDFCK